MFKRILVVSTCFVALICFLVFPAGAAGIDYNDYVSDVVVDGDNDLVTVTIPGSMCYVELYDFNNSLTTYSGTGSVHDLDLAVNTSYLFRMHIFGYPWSKSGGLDISNIPVDTVIRCAFSSSIPYDGSGTPGIIYSIYRDSSFVNVYHASSDYTFTGGVKYFDFALRKPNDAVYLEIENSINFAVFDPGTYNFIVHDTVLEMSISSLLRQQQISGKTNKLLDEVIKQLADQGQTLDDVLGAQQDTNNKLDGIINDKVDPSLPSDGDIVGDLDDAEGQIRDDAQSGLDQGASVQQSAIQVMGQYLSAFACVSWIFDRFSTIPFVSGLLALSFSLGITGAILGIGLSIFNSYSSAERSRAARSARSSRSSRSKGG